MTANSSSSARPSASGFYRAPWVVRFGSDFVDFLVAGVLAAPVSSRLVGGPGEASAGPLVVASAVYAVYEIVCLAVWGKTLGRRWSSLAVRRIDGVRTSRGGIGLGPAVLRWALKTFTPISYLAIAFKALSSPLELLQNGAFFFVIGSIFFDPNRRGWHDKAAGTMVVSERRDDDGEGTTKNKGRAD